MARTVIDPVTRVGGQLRIEADIAAGEIRDAWSSGTMFRGIELVMRGRDPRDAWMFAERICGTCTGVHALASVRAVERAFGISIPTNARLIRNLLAATQAVRDHVVQFYLSQLPDWADAKAALGADPTATANLARSLSAWPQSSVAHFTDVRSRLASVIESGQPGPYANGYWGHPAYLLSPEQDLLLLSHALEALDWQRKLMRIHALIGGRDPHPQTYLVGGMALVPDWSGPTAPGAHPPVPDRDSPSALSDAGLEIVDNLIETARTFAAQVLVPDVLMLAKAYPEWAAIGHGVDNYLSAGEFPDDDASAPALYLPAGRIMARDLATAQAVDQAAITETVTHAWYAAASGDGSALRPSDPGPEPAWSGPALPLTTLEGADRYSWTKAARYDAVAMEVGPIARMLVAYVNGHAPARRGLDAAMSALEKGPDALFGTLGRIMAKAVETQILADRAAGWLEELKSSFAGGDLATVDLHSWAPESWPATADGWSLGEGPRGTVGHWVTVEDRVVRHYQVVDATTWNASPRDALGARGPIEAALVGMRVSDPAQPLEILRTVHSFDPCMACAVHAAGRPGPIEIHLRDREARR